VSAVSSGASQELRARGLRRAGSVSDRSEDKLRSLTLPARRPKNPRNIFPRVRDTMTAAETGSAAIVVPMGNCHERRGRFARRIAGFDPPVWTPDYAGPVLPRDRHLAGDGGPVLRLVDEVANRGRIAGSCPDAADVGRFAAVAISPPDQAIGGGVRTVAVGTGRLESGAGRREPIHLRDEIGGWPRRGFARLGSQEGCSRHSA